MPRIDTDLRLAAEQQAQIAGGEDGGLPTRVRPSCQNYEQPEHPQAPAFPGQRRRQGGKRRAKEERQSGVCDFAAQNAGHQQQDHRKQRALHIAMTVGLTKPGKQSEKKETP